MCVFVCLFVYCKSQTTRCMIICWSLSDYVYRIFILITYLFIILVKWKYRNKIHKVILIDLSWFSNPFESFVSTQVPKSSAPRQYPTAVNSVTYQFGIKNSYVHVLGAICRSPRVFQRNMLKKFQTPPQGLRYDLLYDLCFGIRQGSAFPPKCWQKTLLCFQNVSNNLH